MARREPKTRDKVPILAPEEVPEVAEYMVADQELNEFIEDMQENNPDVLNTLRELTEHRNAALEAADKAVRARESQCGPFLVHTVRTTYNAEALYDALGEERFTQLGGTVTKKPVYEIDGKRLEAAIAMGKLSSEVVKAVKTRQVQFKQIGKVSVP